MIRRCPLDGVRVLDLTPGAGGTVLHHESRRPRRRGHQDRGARTRRRLARLRAHASRPATLATYYSVNRGKKSVTIDLRIAEGAALLLELAREVRCGASRIFRPARWSVSGSDYRRLSAANPRDHPVLDFGLRAERTDGFRAGLRHRRAGARRHHEHHGSAGRRPDAMRRVDRRFVRRALRRHRDPVGAARARPRPASGQHLDIAMLDCQVAMLEDALARYSVSGKVPGPIGTRHPSITPFQQFRARRRIFRRRRGQRIDLAAHVRRDRDAGAERRPALYAQRRSHGESCRTRSDPRRAFRDARRARYWLELLERRAACHARRSPTSRRSRAIRICKARRMILHADHPSFDGSDRARLTARNRRLDRDARYSRAELGEHTETCWERCWTGQTRLSELRSRSII